MLPDLELRFSISFGSHLAISLDIYRNGSVMIVFVAFYVNIFHLFCL